MEVNLTETINPYKIIKLDLLGYDLVDLCGIQGLILNKDRFYRALCFEQYYKSERELAKEIENESSQECDYEGSLILVRAMFRVSKLK